MGKTPNYFIVEAGALPEVFLKVAQAKQMLETGEATTVNLATRQVGSAAAHSINIRMRSAPSTTCCTGASSPFRSC